MISSVISSLIESECQFWPHLRILKIYMVFKKPQQLCFGEFPNYKFRDPIFFMLFV